MVSRDVVFNEEEKIDKFHKDRYKQVSQTPEV